MSAFKYQWNQTIDVGTAGLLPKQWTSIRHILSLLVTANACVHVTAYVAVHVTAYVAVRRSLSTTYTAVVLGLLLRQYVSYQFGVWAVIYTNTTTPCTVHAAPPFIFTHNSALYPPKRLLNTYWRIIHTEMLFTFTQNAALYIHTMTPQTHRYAFLMSA